jgi:hypothetical protein
MDNVQNYDSFDGRECLAEGPQSIIAVLLQSLEKTNKKTNSMV